jgi:predicted NAD-dependent protein-ADP-ribosyltransferase YbiA (DUF1768 family)
VISKATFETLTSKAERPMPLAKPPVIHNITMNKSECGSYVFHLDDNILILVVPSNTERPSGLMVVAFYSKLFSNFIQRTGDAIWTVNGKPVHFKNAEQFFKSVCPIAHMNCLDDTSPDAITLQQILNDVMSAKSPIECKLAPFAIPKHVFKPEVWDSMSFEVMAWAQIWKFQCPVHHQILSQFGEIAMSYGVHPQKMFFVEGAGSKDRIWGCGLTIEELYASLDHSITKNKNVDASKLGYADVSIDFSGKNLLGKAIGLASRVVLGENFEFLANKETVEAYTARVGTTCHLFEYLDEDDSQKTELEDGEVQESEPEDACMDGSEATGEGDQRTGSSPKKPKIDACLIRSLSQ